MSYPPEYLPSNGITIYWDDLESVCKRCMDARQMAINLRNEARKFDAIAKGAKQAAIKMGIKPEDISYIADRENGNV